MTGHPWLGWATQPPTLGGPYGDQGFWFFKSTVRDGCSIFTAEVEAINKVLTYVKVSTRKSFVIFSDSMSVLQAIESQ